MKTVPHSSVSIKGALMSTVHVAELQHAMPFYEEDLLLLFVLYYAWQGWPLVCKTQKGNLSLVLSKTYLVNHNVF